ncbi:hypothetical protein [Idiomarina ramblicola]|uniref:hypothetical protein n=1 Tax=Idiomarina ramblicola TaxID=263724 RepID=UPI000F86DC88|nr:hypothetical protein [Idiomarina ramblicola]
MADDSIPLSEKSDKEYRAVLHHFEDVIPDDLDPLYSVALLTPYGFLDVHPTQYTDVEKRQSFANFNLGAISNGMLRLDESQVESLSNLALCYEDSCRKRRIDAIKVFLDKVKPHLTVFKKNRELEVIQQISTELYRINNAFISPVEILTYEPSKDAGFVPSSQYTKHRTLNELPKIQKYSEDSEVLIEVMNEYNVSAIAKIEDGGLNIVFGGFADNHWGAVLYEADFRLAEIGETNQLGYEYDDIEKISDTAFYYQTN